MVQRSQALYAAQLVQKPVEGREGASFGSVVAGYAVGVVGVLVGGRVLSAYWGWFVQSAWPAIGPLSWGHAVGLLTLTHAFVTRHMQRDDGVLGWPRVAQSVVAVPVTWGVLYLFGLTVHALVGGWLP